MSDEVKFLPINEVREVEATLQFGGKPIYTAWWDYYMSVPGFGAGYEPKTPNVVEDYLLCKRDMERGVPKAVELMTGFIAYRMNLEGY